MAFQPTCSNSDEMLNNNNGSTLETMEKKERGENQNEIRLQCDTHFVRLTDLAHILSNAFDNSNFDLHSLSNFRSDFYLEQHSSLSISMMPQ